MVSKIDPYNPYDLVQLIVNDYPQYGRPIEFDSVITNQKTLLNAFGNIVKPTKVVTTCPDCGAGITVEIILDGSPPFAPYPVSCTCARKIQPTPILDPFINPITAGLIKIDSLNPLTKEGYKPLPKSDITVADKIKQNRRTIVELEPADGIDAEVDIE